MKKIVLTAITALILYTPSVCLSSYLIELQSGGEFVTDQYWEEDNHIKFYSYGGLVDLPKKEIRSITESDHAVPEASVNESGNSESSFHKTPDVNSEQPIPEKKADAATVDSENETQQKNNQSAIANNKEEDQLIDITYYRNKKAELQALMDTSLKQLKVATRNKDKEAKEKAREEISKVSGEIYKLTDEVKEKNNGELPENWW